MKYSSARAIACGLSTISLTGMVAVPVQAEASDESESLFGVSQDTPVEEIIYNDESAAYDEANSLSESIEETLPNNVNNTELPEATEAQEDIKDAAEAVSNIDKSKQAMDEAVGQQEGIISDADEKSETIDNSAKEAYEEANKAAEAVVDKNTSKNEAETLIADAEKTVEQASNDFEDAEASYNKALNDFVAAKEDYQTAVAAYNSNKEKALNDLGEAEASLSEAEAKLQKMQAELEAARQGLVDAGAEALIAAEDNHADVTAYVETVVKYYYIPNKELKDGQQISQFQVLASNDKFVSISYDVVDENGNILRTVTADYGYDVDKATGEISLYDNKLYYEYTDANGQVVRITKDQASELENNRIEIGKYWTATGFYIPRYKQEASYYGTISYINYSDAKAIAQGKAAVAENYVDNPFYYNTDIQYKEGTKTPLLVHYALNLKYNIFYDQVEVYYPVTTKESYQSLVNRLAGSGKRVISTVAEYKMGIVRYVREYALSEDASSKEYSSYADAIAAVTKEAAAKRGATGIDYENSSNLSIKEYSKYAQLFEKHINEGKALFESNEKAYVAHIASVRTQLSDYARLLSEVSKAREDYADAKSRVISLQNSVAALNGADDIATAAKQAALEAKLEKAKLKMDSAKENLIQAKELLNQAKVSYNNRFTAIPIVPTINQPIQEIVNLIPDEVLDEELEEELEKEDVVNPIINNNSSADGGFGAGDDAAALEEDAPEIAEELPQVVTIPEEETPTGITVAGLLARGKWFVGLAGVSTAGIGVAVLEAKHRAAIKLLDKLNS